MRRPECGAPEKTRAIQPLDPNSGASSQVRSGRQTFVVVPEQSKASYLANEEFFAGALKKLGITAGKRTVVGSTQSIEVIPAGIRTADRRSGRQHVHRADGHAHHDQPRRDQ